MEINKLPPKIQEIEQRYGVVGQSSGLIRALERALQVAPINLSVLIIGESGTGKEVFPRIIHDNSARKHKKYFAVNCGALPEGTIDSELFGHVKGAFTGATADRKGYFEEANGGTLFLDEVAELPLTTQARLLRVLENGEFIKVGSSEVERTDIRIVAATNKDLLRGVREGKFREDLYYRLSTVRIDIPPLRDRGNDILLLTRKFAHDFATQNMRPAVKFADDAKRDLLAYNWPGNVRQLKNIIDQIALYEAGKEVTHATIAQQGYLPQESNSRSLVVNTGEAQATFDYNKEREVVFKMIMRLQNEIDSIKETLENSDGHARSLTRLNADVAELKRESRTLMKYPDATHPAVHRGVSVDEVKATPVYDDDEEAEEATAAGSQPDDEIHTLADTERETITEALKRNKGKRKKTADDLHISERTLYRKIKAYGLEDKEQ